LIAARSGDPASTDERATRVTAALVTGGNISPDIARQLAI
jgi:hypothetical protein